LDLDRRHRKRGEYINYILYWCADYKAALWYKSVPKLPDPDDRHISKRVWEKDVMKLRIALKDIRKHADLAGYATVGIPTVIWLGGPEWRLEAEEWRFEAED